MLDQDSNPESDDAPGAPEQASAPSLEIANAVARVHKQFVGRGPANSRVTIDGDLVVCLLEGGYTKAEQTLEDNNRGDVVAAGRLGLQDAMRAALVAAVETTLGRRVQSFMSANDVRHDLQVEVFVLRDDSAGPAGSRAA
jgi:uncharacterized protein YbcI